MIAPDTVEKPAASVAIAPRIWQVGPEHALTLDHPRLIGILNVTPDSFSDGGAYPSADDAIAAAIRLWKEGASIIDIGGESTRPGAQPVSEQEQIARTVGVIHGIREQVTSENLLVSIDTTRCAVAAAALDAGADIINDVSAGTDDPAMFALAALRRCGLVLMHRRSAPSMDSYSTQYRAEPDYGGDVVAAVKSYLANRCDAAVQAGVQRDRIVIDPGLGFGKSVSQNFALAARSAELVALGFPVFSAASRKSFLGAVTGESSPAQRDSATVALSVMHLVAGLRLFRVHNVAAHLQAFAVVGALSGHSDPDHESSAPL